MGMFGLEVQVDSGVCRELLFAEADVDAGGGVAHFFLTLAFSRPIHQFNFNDFKI